MLFASLLIFVKVDAFSQSYIDLLGKNEYSTPFLNYKSDSSYLETYSIVSSSSSIPPIDPSTEVYYCTISSSLNLLSLKKVDLPVNPGFHYHKLDWIEGVKGKVLASRYNLSMLMNSSAFFPYLSNCDLCDITSDSIYNCMPLMPDSAYIGNISGSTLNGDSLILLAEYYMGRNASTTDYKVYKISIDTATSGLKRKELKYSKGGVDYYPRARPFKLPNGNWFVQATRDSAQNSGGMNYLTLSKSWDSLISIHHVSSINNVPFNRGWLINNKFVFVNTEVVDISNWKPSDPIQEQLTLVEYDYINDSITNKYRISLTNSSKRKYHYQAGFEAIYKSGYFFISFNRSEDFLGSPFTALGVAIIDSNFKELGSIVVEDSVGFYSPLILGTLNAISQGKSSTEYFYMGAIDDADVNSGGFTSDLILGKIDFNTIGLEETISIKRQQTWMYPNPNNGTFKLTNTAQPFKEYQFSIFDSKGVEVYKGKADNPKQDFSLKLTSGVYYLVTDEGDVISFIAE